MPKIVAYLFVLVLFLFFSPPVFAISLDVGNVPSSLNEEQEFTITVNISSAAANTTNYLRAAFYSEAASTSYFGYTFNHLGNWYNGSPSPIDPHQFLQIQIGSDGTWSGDLKAKADIADSAFKSSGDYFFKIGRYTASATSISSDNWSQATPISITATAPTPTPSPSPTPSSSSTSQSKSPTPTPKVTSTATAKSPSPTLAKQSPLILSARDQDSLSTSELSIESSPSPSPSPEATQSALSKTKVAGILVGSGTILIGLSIGFYLWYKRILRSSPAFREGRDAGLKKVLEQRTQREKDEPQ